MPDDDLARLNLRVLLILENTREWVSEDRQRLCKINPVSDAIGLSFFRVPLKLQAHSWRSYHKAGVCNGSPNANGSPAFGCPCGGHQYNVGNAQISSAWPARIMQFALKLMF